jgi:hypothetical protein
MATSPGQHTPHLWVEALVSAAAQGAESIVVQARRCRATAEDAAPVYVKLVGCAAKVDLLLAAVLRHGRVCAAAVARTG